jgi:hypothetical protein
MKPQAHQPWDEEMNPIYTQPLEPIDVVFDHTVFRVGVPLIIKLKNQ